MNVVISVLLLIVTTVSAKNVCTDTSQCQSGHCCQILSQFLFVSKRGLVTSLKPMKKKEGSCEPYKKEGEVCNIININYNGFCGCEDGTECKRARLFTTGPPSMTTVPTTVPPPMTTVPYTTTNHWTTSPPPTTTPFPTIAPSMTLTSNWPTTVPYLTTTQSRNKWRTTTVPRDLTAFGTRSSPFITTTPLYKVRVGRTVPTAPPGYAEEFTCIRKQ